MKKFTILLSTCALSFAANLYAQEETKTEKENPLEISGSVDLYYKYDFSGNANVPTSFADHQNSVSIGMIDVGLSKTVGKASFVGEISFGPRGQSQSIPNVDDGNSFHIQNLYTSYAFTEQLSLTAGYMGTFIGYEVISPTGNFNYTTSYLFTNGPFQNGGVKLDYAFSDRFAVMVGLFNDWNVYFDGNGISDFGAQIFFSPVAGWSTYLNFITGSPSGTEIDLTTGFQITDAFYLGLNAADRFIDNEIAAESGLFGFSGVALYPQYAFSEMFSLGLRAEYFDEKDVKVSDVVVREGSAYTALTITGNLKSGPLTFIPELRIDTSNDNNFLNGDEEAAKSASQILLGVVYAF